MVRYADDFVVLCQSQHQAQAAPQAIRQRMGEAGLTLRTTKTRIVDALQRGGFDFLGYHFGRGKDWPRAKIRNDGQTPSLSKRACTFCVQTRD